MIRFRIAMLFLILWAILLFNIERPEINRFGIFNIDLSSGVYVLVSVIMVATLMLPELSQIELWKLLVPAYVVYAGVKLVLGFVDDAVIFITVMEILVIFISVWLARTVSKSFLNLEIALEDVVLNRHSSVIVGMEEGSERISLELFRAKRANIPLGVIYLHINLLEEMQENLSDRFNVQASFRRRYVQGQVAKNVEALIHRGDVIAWHNDNLLIAMPGSNHEQARKLAQDIFQRLEVRLGVQMNMGIGVFPEDGLVYEELVQHAIENTNGFAPTITRQTRPFHDTYFRETQELKLNKNIFKNEIALSPAHAAELAAKNLSSSVGAFYPSSIADWFTPAEVLSANIYKTFPAYQQSWIEAADWLENLAYQSSSARLLYAQVKRAFDVVMVTLTAPITLFIGGIIALLIYLQDRGPIFFVQERMGYGGRTFKMIKFRTMVPDAEAKLKELAEQGLAKLDERGKLAEPLKLKVDPRVTRIGRILRKTSLDELPQLINVFRGEMSIVGPRPTSWDLSSYDLFQTERLSVRPGVTGLLQVYDRGNTDFETWVKWDLKYIDKMCLYLDLRLIIMTFMMILFKRKGAR